MRLLAFGCLIFLVSYSVSAFTEINLYVEDTGRTLFLGETSEEYLVLPNGITLSQERITGYTNEITEKSGDRWRFHLSVPSSRLTVFLPRGAVVNSSGAADISVKDGQIVLSALNTIDVEYKINASERISLWFVLGILFGVICLGLAAMVWYQSRKRKELANNRARLTSFLHLLNERQQLIIRTLDKTGRIKSSYLRKQCNLPKASFSRHIRELANKKLIILSGEGKNKIIELKKRFQ